MRFDRRVTQSTQDFDLAVSLQNAAKYSDTTKLSTLCVPSSPKPEPNQPQHSTDRELSLGRTRFQKLGGLLEHSRHQHDLTDPDILPTITWCSTVPSINTCPDRRNN